MLPIRDGGEIFRYLRRHLVWLQERLGVEVLVIDSGSTDTTADDAERAGLRVHRIAPAQFGHGRTRNLGVRLATGDVVCFLTHDVLPCTPDWPLAFAAAFEDASVAGVYGRQVPRDATTMEMFFVSLNYPAERLRFDPQPQGHHPRPGRVLFSNAFSALRRDIALRIPFVEDIPYAEDLVWAHQVLKAGYSLIYEPRAEALHAHRYTTRGLFRRTYLVGKALHGFELDGGASLPESARFLAAELRYFFRQGHVHRLPQLLAYEFIRWAGFQVGRKSRWKPRGRSGAGEPAGVAAGGGAS
ncbi:MAG: glycosyltransferase family 2 protein [Gemmatimonadetes bacterium]|nr:glycosyltransferase family 2 protein [Gemmatimonadota bacterium]